MPSWSSLNNNTAGISCQDGRSGEEVVVGQDVVMASEQGSLMRLCFRFNGIACGESMASSLQALVDRHPQMCGSFTWSKRDNKKVLELVWGGKDFKWSPVMFTVSESPNKCPPCTRHHVWQHVPSFPRGCFMAVHLVNFTGSKCSLMLVVISHTFTDAAGWMNLFAEWSGLCQGSEHVPGRQLTFTRFPNILLSEIECTEVEKRAGYSKPHTQKDLKALWSHWMNWSPLSSIFAHLLCAAPKMIYEYVFSQETVFRFNSDSLEELTTKCDNNKCTKNSVLYALIISSLHLLSPHISRKRGGTGVVMLFDLRGDRCGTSVPKEFVGNSHLNLRMWIPIETLDCAADALKTEGPRGCVGVLAPLFQSWLQKQMVGTTGVEQLCWFSRVHHLGLDDKLGIGAAGVIW
ncbi:hypothetical protein Pelo_7158 [Pelomyxa schiedti]|nr:hypothetical protein Pelo_7158 [Pelomyxa schiedti]